MLGWLRRASRRGSQEETGSATSVPSVFVRAEKALRRVIVPGFDVDMVSSGVVRRLRWTGDTLVVFVDYTGSDPSCSFCRFINDRLWESILSRARRELEREGFTRIVFVDEATGMEIR